ncbi:MAG: AAA family ATPase [Clostridiaceae bacterium]|nr:AAA family ATPase [Clostridiaceae bacterium]
MNQEILKKLKSTPELSPDVHDGSYELVRTIVSAYRDVDEAVLDFQDLNAIYLMCIGTWRHSYDKKHEAVHATHLSEVRKQELDHLIDDLKNRADAGVYKYQEKAVSGTGHIGMFGTGFYSFQGKTDIQSVCAFIGMCVDILDMTDDEEMFRRAALVLTKSFRGMQAAAASVVLHCLKPLTFPVINSNVGSEDIFAALGIELKSRGKLESYVDNCRKIKTFRDANFSFKNYRILDMAAWELSADPIRRVVSQYKESFDAWFPEEAYKWRAVQCFQEHWNPERSDFAEMLKESLAQAGNLMDTNYSFPRKMITFFAEKEPDTVRDMFQRLLTPQADVVEEIQNFEKSADTLLAKYQFKESMKQHYQGDRTICTYLFFAQPDRYFLYQYGKLKAFLEETGLNDTCKKGDTQNILTYQEVANRVLSCVQQDSELLNMFQIKRAELGREYYPDAEHHLLADDIIYFGSQLNKSDYWPSLAEYDPEINTEQWLELLADRTVCTVENLQILKAIQQAGGEATCKQLSLTLGDTSAHYNGSMVQLARRVQEKTGCPLVQNENNDQKWWPILFVGRTALQDQPGTYSWKLRDELADALKRLPPIEVNKPMPFAKNTILYGPPGTGKTYQTVNYAVSIIEGKLLKDIQAENHEEVLKRYRQYRQDGRIEFTTFHQSFGYEDFLEGIRPVFAEDKEENPNDISYEIADGIFKKFCATAQPPVVDPNQNPYGFSENPTIWKVSLASTGDNPVRDYCMEHGCIRIGWDEYGESITDDMDYHVGGKTVLNAFLSRMQPGDIILSCYTAHSIDAIGVVTGEPEWHPEFDHYKRLRTVKWLVQGKNIEITEFRLEKSLTLSTVYRLNTTVATVIDVLNKNGFSGVSSAKGTKGPYVFIIDEINRGNISKIFGELITLIEPSKRLGQSEELQAKLPYSHEAFGIPYNVYLLGTMNTADRSIALLDTALRRRFSFVEMMPDSSVLDGIEVEGISISGLLTTLNRRIEVLFDREHTLGHAFFTPLRQSPSIETLGEIFRDKVVPLLQEYFYDDYEKICLVLGDRKRPEQQQFFKVETTDLQSLFGVEPEFEVNPTYRINPAAFFDVEVYRNL